MLAPGDRITQRTDGRWMGRYTVQTPTGTERKCVYGRTYREAQKKLALAMGDAARGIVYDDENHTVGEYITQWLSDSAKHTVKATTYRTYESQIRNDIVPALGKLKLSRLTPAHLQALYAAKLRGGKKPAGVRQMHAILHKALEQAVRFNLIPTNPASKVDPPKVRQEEITPLTAEQANKLLDVIRNEGDPFEALYFLALTTGLRIGELLGLKWTDIDLDAHRLRVSRQLQRSQEGLIFTEPKVASRRTVDLPARTVEVLKRHRKRQLEGKLTVGGAYQDNALVFTATLGTPLGPEKVTQRSFKPLLKRAGLPEICFHDLRHTFATLLLARGVHPTYVQRALGHASVKMTLDRYSHWMPSMAGHRRSYRRRTVIAQIISIGVMKAAGVIFAARVLPSFNPPRLPRSTAAGCYSSVTQHPPMDHFCAAAVIYATPFSPVVSKWCQRPLWAPGCFSLL